MALLAPVARLPSARTGRTPSLATPVDQPPALSAVGGLCAFLVHFLCFRDVLLCRIVWRDGHLAT